MALNFKKVTFVVGLSLTVIVICSVLYVFTVGWEQQNNDVVGPGRFSDPSLKIVTVVFYFDRWDNEKGEEILIPICGNPCKFEDFKKLLTNNFSGSWEDECQKI